MNSKRHLYRKEVSVVAPEWKDLEERKVTPPGTPVSKVGPSAFRVLLRAASDDKLEPAIEPLPRGSSFVRDEAELQHRVNQARHLDAMLIASQHPWAHLEQDQSRKITFQRGGPPGWFIIPEGLIRSHSPSMKEAFIVLGDWLRSKPELDMPAARYRLGTNHGWPDYRTTNLSFLLHALWAAASESFDDLEDKGLTIAGILGESLTPMSAALFSRTGPLGKPVLGISRQQSGAVIDSELKGLCCRRRIVFGMPSAGNMFQLERVARVKTRVEQIPFFYHAGPADVASKVHAVHRPGWVWFSDDISGYDQSVSDTHQRELGQFVVAPLIDSAFADFKMEWKDIPLLGPSLDTSNEAFLYLKRGMTPSGDLMTAFDGTTINAARVITCVARARGISERDARADWGVRWAAFIQGDDTVLGFQKGLIDIAKYAEVSAELGYNTKLITGCVFLMHLIEPKTGVWAPLASRVFQQTVFNEYGGRHPSIELLSFMARTPGHFWARNPWAQSVANMLKDSEPFKRYHVRPDTAAFAMTDPAFRHDVERELKTTPKKDERFKGLTNPVLSSVAAGLLSDTREAPMPRLTRDAAWEAAQRVAQIMATPLEHRSPTAVANIKPLAAYWAVIEGHDDDQSDDQDS
jgi:hypothetical protein